MKLWVPSMGSMYQRARPAPSSRPYSSPTSPWSGKAAWIRSRMSCSIARSAAVTNVRSGLVMTSTSRRNERSAISSAASQADWAKASQPSRSSLDARAQVALQAGP